MTRLARIDLDLGIKIGAGAQGSLYRVDGVGSPMTPSFGFDVIYKEFHPNTQVSGPALDLLARFRHDLDDHDRDVVDAMTVWPCAVVDDGSGRACGYLMQRLPDRFVQHIETTTGAETIAREIQQLFVPEAIARKNLGETANRVERLALVRDLAYIIGFLHKRDFVYGDLSYKNAVFCLRPQPGVMLLDCDAIRKVGQASAVAQLHSPGWKPPEGGPQTKATDRYKLGLCVLRCLTPGVNAQNRDPDKAGGVLDSEGMSLLRRALSGDPGARTSGKEWVLYLNRTIAAAGGVKQRVGSAPAPPRATVRRAPPPANRPTLTPVGRRVTAGASPAVTQVFTRARSGALRVSKSGRGVVNPFGTPTGPNAPNAFGNPSGRSAVPWRPPAPSSGGDSFQAWMIAVWIVILIALFGVFVAGVTSSGTTPSTRSRSTGTAPIPDVSAVALQWSNDAQRAVAAVEAEQRSAASVPARISTRGSAQPSGVVGNQTLGQGPQRWIVDVLAPPGPNAAASITPFAVDKEMVTSLGAFNTSGAFSPLPKDWDVSLQRAIRTVGTQGGQAQDRLVSPMELRWTCDLRPPATDCRWLFEFRYEGGPIDAVWVSADGWTIGDPPPWATQKPG